MQPSSLRPVQLRIPASLRRAQPRDFRTHVCPQLSRDNKNFFSHGASQQKSDSSDPRIRDLGREIADDFARIRDHYGESFSVPATRGGIGNFQSGQDGFSSFN